MSQTCEDCDSDEGPVTTSGINGCSNPATMGPMTRDDPCWTISCDFATAGFSGNTGGCNYHDNCYQTCGSSKDVCDEQFEDSLEHYCGSHFSYGAEAECRFGRIPTPSWSITPHNHEMLLREDNGQVAAVTLVNCNKDEVSYQLLGSGAI